MKKKNRKTFDIWKRQNLVDGDNFQISILKVGMYYFLYNKKIDVSQQNI